MLSPTLPTVFALASLTTAFPQLATPDFKLDLERRAGHPYQLNPVGSVRAPCPGMNTLANHGFINRSGRGITRQALQQGFFDAFNMGFDSTDAGAINALNQCGALTKRTCNSFDLDMMDLPHAIEHDASLSRRDRQMFHDQNANNVAFNQTIWNRSLAIYGATSHIGIKFANTARRKRVEQAMGADFPGWFRENVGGSLAEHAFILSTMNDPAFNINLNAPGANPQARMDWFNYWIVHMELPTALGWRRPSRTISKANIQSLAAAVQNAPTVTVNPGPSPFIGRKRSVEAPTPSYNLELEEREIVPLTAVPTLAADPETAPEVARAKALASAVAGPPPAQPNAYDDVLSPGQWSSLVVKNDKYTAKYRKALAGSLGELLPPAEARGLRL